MSVALSVGTTLAISDYSSLVTAVESHIDRDDLTSHLPRFIQLTESHLGRKLRTLDMETTTLLTASSEDVSLPDDFLSMRSLYVEGSDSPDYPLRGLSPAALAQEFSGVSAAIPTAYAQIGNTVKLAPPPSATVTLEMVYLAKFAPLTATTVTNWILENHPDIYFYGTVAQALAFIKDPEASAYLGLFDQMVADLISARQKDRWGAGPLVPNTVRQVRGARC